MTEDTNALEQACKEGAASEIKDVFRFRRR